MDGMVTRFELDWCQVFQTLVRPNVVVVPMPGIDDPARLDAAAEPLQRQALVAELAIKALGVAVLPRFAGIDQRGVDPLLGYTKAVDSATADGTGTSSMKESVQDNCRKW